LGRLCRFEFVDWVFLFLPLKNPRHLDGIVTLVDAAHLIMHLDEEKPEGVENEAVEQVGGTVETWVETGRLKQLRHATDKT